MTPHVEQAAGPGVGPPPESASSFAVEDGQRLSRSVLWRLQRRYYDEAGVAAWSRTAVPHYVTCNPALAYAYAQVFLGLLRDGRLERDPAEPATLVELGAGSGRFAYLFLSALTDLLRRSPLAGTKIRYVMTDFTDSNLRGFQAHERLRPFVDQGVLDFACFDVVEDREIRLRSAGVTLAPGSLASPLGVIANYVFDSIPQDAFSFEGGQLHERLVSVAAPTPVPDPTDPGLLNRLDISFGGRPAPLDYYGEPDLDGILRGYAATLEGATILFPLAAIRCIARLAEISGGGMLLLSADRGHTRADALAQPDQLGLARHGSFSMDVNYHALGAYVTARGGAALVPSYSPGFLCVAGFLLGEHASGWPETRLAYEEAIVRAGPDDAYTIRRELRERTETMGLGPALSLIRASRWDPRTVSDCLPVLWRHQPAASGIEAEEVVRAVTRSWQSYYPIGEEQDLAFELALLLHAYGGHREALALFAESARLHGDDARVRWNMGLCHFALGEVEPALACFREAATLDPAFVPAGAVQLRSAAA